MRKLFLVVLTVMVMVIAPSAVAQQVPPCVAKLDACGPFVNSTTAMPPPACCMALEKALQTELPCMCSVFTPQVIRSLNINVQGAVSLPNRCGLDFDLVAQCQADARTPSPTMAPAPAPAPGMHKHPNKPGHSHPPKHMHPHSPSPSASPSMSSVPAPAQAPHKGNAPSKYASIGSVFGAFLLFATLMFN